MLTDKIDARNSLKQGSTKSPQAKSGLLPVFANKILLNTATPIHLWIIYGSLGATRAELSSYNRDRYGSLSLDYLLCGLNRLLTIIKYQYATGLSKTFFSSSDT